MMKKLKKLFKTEVALMVCMMSLYLGFVWATFFPGAPYAVFASSITGLFAIVAGRRYYDHRLEGQFPQRTED